MPLTEKGEKIERNMKEEYGAKKGESVFYASKNAGRISGVDVARFRRMVGDALARGVPITDALAGGIRDAERARMSVADRVRAVLDEGGMSPQEEENVSTSPNSTPPPGSAPPGGIQGEIVNDRRMNGLDAILDAWSPEAREAAAKARAAHLHSTGNLRGRGSSARHYPISVEHEGKTYGKTGKVGLNTVSGHNAAEYSHHGNGMESRVWRTQHGRIIQDRMSARAESELRRMGARDRRRSVLDALFGDEDDRRAARGTGDVHEGFEKVERSVAAKGAHDPKALAAWIGERKYGKKGMARKAAAAR